MVLSLIHISGVPATSLTDLERNVYDLIARRFIAVFYPDCKFSTTTVLGNVEDIPANEVDNWARIQADRFQNMVIRGFHTELEAVYEDCLLYTSRCV